MKRHLVAFGFAIFLALGSSALGSTDATDDASCRPFFGNACSDAMGRWLPALPNARKHAAITSVDDAIVDPSGGGPMTFLHLRAVKGSSFVFGSAGPSKGHILYDPAHGIALYDVGCCSWHEVVASTRASKPPKTIAERSLADLHTQRGIRFGDSMTKIRSTFGASVAEPVEGKAVEETLSYRRPLAKPFDSCDATMTFLFERKRMIAMDYGNWC